MRSWQCTTLATTGPLPNFLYSFSFTLSANFPLMLFETRIRKLWWELESRDEDPRTIEILKELHEVINEQIEQIHHEVSGLRRLCCPAREVLKVTDGTGQRHSLCSADLQISVYRAASVVLITAKTACLYEEIRNTGQASREPVHPFAAWRPLIPQPPSTEHPHCAPRKISTVGTVIISSQWRFATRYQATTY